MARDLCLTGRSIGAAEALRIGLVSEVFEENGLVDEAVTWGRKLLEAPWKPS